MQDISALSYPVAFAAGFVSFASPCVLALVPGYLTFISGRVLRRARRSRTQDVMVPTIAFVLGFSLMFTAYGASAGLIGYSLTREPGPLNLVAGFLLIVMGIAMVALPQIGLMQTDRRLAMAPGPTTLVGRERWWAPRSPSAGRRASARSSAASSPTPRPPARRGSGATLLFTYSLGLGIPFLLSGLFITRTMATFRWVRDRWTRGQRDGRGRCSS